MGRVIPIRPGITIPPPPAAPPARGELRTALRAICTYPLWLPILFVGAALDHDRLQRIANRIAAGPACDPE